jgi:hypothetical protein
MRATYRRISYQIEDVGEGMRQWSFEPPEGARQTARVRGEAWWATTVVRRAIDIWHLMNRGSRVSKAA